MFGRRLRDICNALTQLILRHRYISLLFDPINELNGDLLLVRGDVRIISWLSLNCVLITQIQLCKFRESLCEDVVVPGSAEVSGTHANQVLRRLLDLLHDSGQSSL